MSEVITFSCPHCSTRYRVANSYAGRTFQCKGCSTHITVPAETEPPPAPSVEMNAGAQVLRRTPVSPQQQRNTDPAQFLSASGDSGRHTPAPAAPAAGNGKMPLMVAGIVLGLTVVVVIVAVVLGGNGDTGGGPIGTPEGQGPTDGPSPKEKLRKDLIARLEAPDATAKDLYGLYGEAIKARLEDADIELIAKRAVEQTRTEGGGEIAGKQLVGFAGSLSSRGLKTFAEQVYEVVIRREPEYVNDEPNPIYWEAQHQLGREKVEYTDLLARVGNLVDVGIDGAEDLRDELLDLEEQSENGWSPAILLDRVRAAEKLAVKLEEEYHALRKRDPFEFEVRRSFARFRQERTGRGGEWTWVQARPFALFVQKHDNESTEAARERVEVLKKWLDAMSVWFDEHVGTTLGLRRTLPHTVSDAELRALTPVEILVLKDERSWRNHLKEVRARYFGTSHIDFSAGRVSTWAEAWQRNEGYAHFCGVLKAAFVDLVNHYNADYLREEEDLKTRDYLRSLFLARSFVDRVMHGIPADLNPQGHEFLADEPSLMWQLGEWRKPFATEDRKILSFGGPALTVKDLVAARNMDKAKQVISLNLEELGVETETARDIARESGPTIYEMYASALFNFLYFYQERGHFKYRKGLESYLRMDLSGELAFADPVEQFGLAMNLSDRGWEELEKAFLAQQKSN